MVGLVRAGFPGSLLHLSCPYVLGATCGGMAHGDRSDGFCDCNCDCQNSRKIRCDCQLYKPYVVTKKVQRDWQMQCVESKDDIGRSNCLVWQAAFASLLCNGSCGLLRLRLPGAV